MEELVDNRTHHRLFAAFINPVPQLEGETPKQASKLEARVRGSQASQTRLFTTPTTADTQWSVLEKLALVEFLLFFGFSAWTACKNDVFWNKCSEFVEIRAKSTVKRTGQ